MKLYASSVRGCQLAPDCQVNWETVELLNQLFVYGIAGVAGVMMTMVLVVYVVLAVRRVVAKGRGLLGVS